MAITGPDEFDLVHSYLGTPFGPPWTLPGTVVARLVDHARIRGDAPFLTTVAADGTAATLSYSETDRRSRQIAGWLHRKADVRPGDVLGIVPRNDACSVLAILAALRAGCQVLLLSPTDPVARVQEQARAVGASPVLYPPGVSDEPLPGAVQLPQLSALPDDPTGDGADAAPDPSDDALLFGTSGSTASAKLVAQSHYNIIVNAEAVRRHHRLRPGDLILGCLPIHHVNGLHFTVFGTLVSGTHLVLPHAFHPLRYPALIERFRPRLASVVPSLLEALLEVWRDTAALGGFEYFVTAAAPLSAGTARELLRRKNLRVLQGYGLTETTNFSTTIPPSVSPETYRRLVTEADIPSIGVAMYGNEVAVLRPDGSRADPGEAGEICMRGHNVMMRYAGNPDATRAAFEHGWFHSQDLGFTVVDKESGDHYFVITGRSKNIAKVGGETVSLEEMERVLRALPGVRDAACASVPHRFSGEQIVAAVVLDGQDLPDVRGHLRHSFAAAVLPQQITTVEAIPRTPTGKILRPQLLRMLTDPAAR